VLAKTTIIGRLGKDPTTRYTAQGKAVCNFSVATDLGWGDNKKTVWYRVTAWEKLAEICQQYLAKGRMVYVEGTLQEPKPFQMRDGTWACNLEMTAREVKFLGGREDGGQAKAAQPQAAAEGVLAGSEPIPSLDEFEIPF
jgi:single-strand DNA-binding protein